MFDAVFEKRRGGKLYLSQSNLMNDSALVAYVRRVKKQREFLLLFSFGENGQIRFILGHKNNHPTQNLSPKCLVL